jgi:tetratricopeptide (TPR) repeat protein
MQPPVPLKVFYAYARVDARYRSEMSKHFVDLRNRGLIEDFFDGDIESGEDWDRRIRQELEDADLILLLISTDFMSSAYGAGVELARALQRHDERTARVVPILVRPILIKDKSLSALQTLPRNGVPLSIWPDQDSAYVSIATDLEKLVEDVRRNRPQLEELRLASIARAYPRIPREPVVPFVSRRGRDGEDLVQRISAALSGLDKAVLALWGGGGVGKTTIAAQVGRELMDSFSGRIAWVSAEGRDNYCLENLVDDAGSQLGCPTVVLDRQTGTRSRQVAALIGNRPALIIFDNMETVSLEEAARCVDWLVRDLRSAVLITTRDFVKKVRNFPLEAMSASEGKEFLNRLSQQSQYPEAMRQHAEAMIRISEANPLVLQWIVSQVDLAQDPVDVFRELQHDEGDAAKRVFDRSFYLPQTGDDGRSVLLALALFPDSASRSSLAFVAGFNDDLRRVNDAIARLAGLRLIGFGNTLNRIRVEGLTRELAVAKLNENGLLARFETRFVEYFDLLLQKHGGADPSDHGVLAVEIANLKLAATLADQMKACESFFSIASVVAAPIDGVLVLDGQWRDAAQMNERAVEIAREMKDERSVQFFSHCLGVILMAKGQGTKAEELLKDSLRAAERNHDPFHAAATINELGTVHFMRGDNGKARSLYEKSLKLSSFHGNLAAQGVSLHQLGLLAKEAGDLESARTLFVESVRAKQSQPESVSLARSLIEIGALAEAQGNEAESAQAYVFASQILKRLESPVVPEVQELLNLIATKKRDATEQQ